MTNPYKQLGHNVVKFSLLTHLALMKYISIVKPAQDEFFRIVEPARKTYEEAIKKDISVAQKASEDYLKVLTPAWMKEASVQRPAWEAYEQVIAEALTDILYTEIVKI